MNRTQREFCEKKHARLEYEPSAEWQPYDFAWAEYTRRLSEARDEYQRIDDQIKAYYGYGCDGSIQVNFPEPPTIPKPGLRVIEKFEYQWLTRYHPKLLPYHTYHPGRAERLWNGFLTCLAALWAIVCFLFGLVLVLSFIIGTIKLYQQLH